eukprot:TRINITY_DN990_c0_g1_i1.p1 TRINITY_DN990_c0_g1~~TRINITY_DN990_c0_g1_i1.p1  ORF type:complete len:126 (-),score=2.60 TRINITY_DN990_c0_g1_i1:258-635(-)
MKKLALNRRLLSTDFARKLVSHDTRRCDWSHRTFSSASTESVQPTDPNWEQKTLESWKKQGLMDHLGFKMTKVKPGWVELELPFSQKLSQQHGYFHGGVVGTMADNAGGMATFTLTPPGLCKRLC